MRNSSIALWLQILRPFGRKGRFDQLWKNPNFIKRIISIVWDEGHCVSRGRYRPEYRDVERLRYLLRRTSHFMYISHTPSLVLHDVMDILHIRHDNAHIMQRS